MFLDDSGFDRLRELMVAEQIASRGINDPRVLAAFRKVKRHHFVPADLIDSAYEDHPLPVGSGQTISQPYIVALMTESLELKGGEKVLEVGTGSGYQAAILAELAGTVYTVEREKALLENAKKALAKEGYGNVRFKLGDGTLGWKEEGPFDRIIVTAASPDVPAPLKEQLADGGIMVIPVGTRFSQLLVTVRKEGLDFTSDTLCGCVFVPLVGEYGWRE